MSANINATRQDAKKRILLIAANPSTSPTTGWPVGFWWSEVTHPYWEFIEAGYEVEIRSPQGGALVADGYSDPEDASGYSAHDILSLGFKHSPPHAALLANTPAIADVRVADYDAIFVSGGQSPMITFVNDEVLRALVVAFHEAGKITALVCHATCVLLHATRADGTRLVEGKTWTGFADSEEQFADSFVGQRIQPFWIESEARALPNTNFIVDARFRPFAVRDGLLITGQQQFSGREAARLVIESLGR
jgi:putative intracellular protease/amidase